MPGLAEALVAVHPLRKRNTARGIVSWREAGAGPALVLLHGIGNQSAAWVLQLEAFAPQFRVIAWDAPGYGESAALQAQLPAAADYAGSLAALLDVLEVSRAVLVGSSLGALMAGAFAARWPERVAGLMLLNPAAGYGAAEPAEREAKLAARLARLQTLGPAGMARELSPGMLSAAASAQARSLAAWCTERIRPDGYRQAARMLASGRLAEDLARYAGPALVVAGTADSVTPAAGCERLARVLPRGSFRLLQGAAHLSYLDVPAVVNAMLAEFAARCSEEAAA